HIGTALLKITCGFFFFTPGISAIINVYFIIHFFAGKFYLIAIGNNDKISAINVRSIIGFVLTTENGRYFSAHATNGLISAVNNVPVTLHGSLVRMFSGEM